MKASALVAQLQQGIAEAVNKCTNSNRPLIFIAGDFNGAIVSPLCKEYDLYQLNKKNTRKEALLDIIITNAPKCFTCSNRPPLGNGDHQVVIATPPLSLYKKTRLPNRKVTIRSGNINDTVASIRSSDIDSKIGSLGAQEGMDVFYRELLAAENACQPKRIVKVRDDKPWMTPELKELIQLRQRLYFTGPPEE